MLGKAAIDRTAVLGGKAAIDRTAVLGGNKSEFVPERNSARRHLRFSCRRWQGSASGPGRFTPEESYPIPIRYKGGWVSETV